MKWLKKITSLFLAGLLLFDAIPAFADTAELTYVSGSGSTYTKYMVDGNTSTGYELAGNESAVFLLPANATSISLLGRSNGSGTSPFTITYSTSTSFNGTPNYSSSWSGTSLVSKSFGVPAGSVYVKFSSTAYTNVNLYWNAWINEATATYQDLTPPDNVTNLQVSGHTTNTVTLSWTNPSGANNTDFAKCNIYQNGTLITSVDKSLSSYQVPNLSPSTNYNFKVTTVDAAGNESTGTIITATTDPMPDNTPPGPVSSVVATGTSETSIQINFSPPSDSDYDHTDLWRGDTKIATIPAGTTIYTDNGVTSQPGGTPYTYTLYAYDHAGNQSAPTDVTTKTLDQTPPANPSNVSAQVQGSDKILLSWANPPDVDFVSVTILRNGNYIYSTTVDQTSYLDTGLQPNSQYTYILQSKDSSNNLSKGASVSAITSGPPQAPTGLQGTPKDGKVSLTWTAPPGTVAGYNVYQNGNQIAGPITSTNYDVTSLTNGTNYVFTVSAINSYGEGAKAAPINLIPTALGKITNLRVTDRTKSYVKFSWDKEPSADHYHIDLTIKSNSSAAAGVADFAAGTQSGTTTIGLETSSTDLTVTNVSPGDTVTASVSGVSSTYGTYGTATTSTTVPSMDVPNLTANTGLSAGDVFSSGASLAGNFWTFLLLSLAFVVAPWIYFVIRRGIKQPQQAETAGTSERAAGRDLNRKIRSDLRKEG